MALLSFLLYIEPVYRRTWTSPFLSVLAMIFVAVFEITLLPGSEMKSITPSAPSGRSSTMTTRLPPSGLDLSSSESHPLRVFSTPSSTNLTSTTSLTNASTPTGSPVSELLFEHSLPASPKSSFEGFVFGFVESPSLSRPNAF